jgi:hypothetical protein
VALPVFVAALLAGTASGPTRAGTGQLELPVQKELLDRISVWVERFVASLDGWAAVETLEQSRWGSKPQPEARRVILSDYYLVRLPAGGPLREFRDAVAVDDKLLLTAEERAQKWLRLVAAATPEEFAAAIADPARHRMHRDQFALLPLLVTRFAERYRDRMKYFFAPERGELPADQVLVGYRQFGGEGLMDLDGQAVYPSGVAWVEANRGAIVRIVEDLRQKNTGYTLQVEFAHQQALGAWLPDSILVRTLEAGRLRWQNEYRYRDWRRFPVASRANGTGASPPPEKPLP